MIMLDVDLSEDREHVYRMDTQGFELKEAILSAIVYELDPKTGYIINKYPLGDAPDWVYRFAIEYIVEHFKQT